ncbi:MAG: hypothetical protein WDZ94_02145 [Patescibacteria group bacterium]
MKIPLKTKQAVKKHFPNGIKKLEIGSGDFPEPDYVHLDVQPSPDLEILGDVRQMPVPDNFVSEDVRAVHIMEHFCHPDYSSQAMRTEIGTTLAILEEVYRVLKPGGRFVMVTPDFEKITASAAKRKVPAHWLQRWSVGGHRNEYDVHHWLWTKQDARQWFEEVGFVECTDWNPVQGWRQLISLDWTAPEIDENPDWFKIEWYHWLFYEGKKPVV